MFDYFAQHRNPLPIMRTWDKVDIVGNASHSKMTERWSYEVPANRLCWVELITVKIVRVESESLNSERARAVVEFSKQPFNTEINVWDVPLAAKAVVGTVGSVVNDHIGQFILWPGAKIKAYSQDEDNGQTDWAITMFGVEFDKV